MSIIDPTLTEPRYLNKADFENQDGLFGYHMQQELGAINPSTTSRDNIPTFLTDNTYDFIMEERGAFGTNGRTMLADDHIGNYVRCAAFVEGGRTSEFGLTTLGDNLLFSTGLADFDDKFAISFWMRMRNGATGNNDKGTVINWNSGTATNGTANGNIFIWRQGTYFLRYTTDGDIAFPTGPGVTKVLSGVPEVADWIHFALVRTFVGNNGNGLWNIYINGVKTEVTSAGNTFGEFSNLDYNEAATALNDGSTFTFDLSEVWLTSEGTDGYGGTIWDDAQVKKMYEIGAGLFRVPDFSSQTKANDTTYGTFTWEAPTGVTAITFSGAASGGGGGTSPTANNVSTNNAAGGGGGGGGAAWLFEESITVIPGQTYTFVVADSAAAGANGSDLTISGQINGSSQTTVTINGGKLGGTGGIGTGNAAGGTAGAGGTSSTTGGEITTSGAGGGGGGASSSGSTSSAAGSAGGNTTVNSITISGGSGGPSGTGNRRRGGGGGGGASILGGGNGGGGSNASAAGAGGGGGGGAGFLIGNAGGTGSAGTGGAGGFNFNYLLPKDSTDNPLVGP